MATSPIYNWPEPDNTDLVKSGALAIRTLGNAIDTTMGTMTPKSIVDAKGDLIAATANDTPARLAVGANGTQLVADSTATTGLRYVATPSASNPILNSAMQVAQRGTTFTNIFTANYTLDRWLAFRGAAKIYNVSQQPTSDTTNLPFIQFCARVGRPSGNTDLQPVFFTQSIETLNSRPFAGKTVTISFYARAGANYSAASTVLVSELISGTGTDQNSIAGFTGATVVVSQNNTLTTTWQRFTATGTVASTANELGLNFLYTPVGTAGAADYFEVTGVQIDIGNVALPYRTAGVSYQEELAMCQRYYYRNTPGTAYGFQGGLAYAQTTTIADTPFSTPVPMRVVPTALEVSNVAINDGTTYYGSGTWTLPASGNGTQITTLRYTHGSVVFVLGKIYLNTNNNNAAGYVGLSAEL
jgi:hypothetical protein